MSLKSEGLDDDLGSAERERERETAREREKGRNCWGSVEQQHIYGRVLQFYTLKI
jgi:hypothetical protein